MTSQENRTQIAESAIKLLREAINDNNKKKILASYDMVEDPSFNWDYLDALFGEWDDLTDQANDIIYEVDN